MHFYTPHQGRHPFDVHINRHRTGSQVIRNVPLTSVLGFLVFRHLRGLQDPQPHAGRADVEHLGTRTTRNVRHIRTNAGLHLRVTNRRVFAHAQRHIRVRNRVSGGLPGEGGFSDRYSTFHASIVISLAAIPTSRAVLASLDTLSSHGTHDSMAIPAGSE